ncbi:unannotated protein [freshwater metagenome]|uniref:Unannotated protein n=1 Tax=freshwater metagenome TaxID=449393 RepID=A0A6J7NU23_9ZZZZ
MADHPIVGEYRVLPGGVRFDATPASVRRHAPLVGQHGDEVLAEIGYTAAEVAALRAEGVLHTLAATDPLP